MIRIGFGAHETIIIIRTPPQKKKKTYIYIYIYIVLGII